MKHLVLIAVVLVLAGCGSRTIAGPGACAGGSPGVEARTGTKGTPLASGLLRVPAALTPGKPEHPYTFGQDLRPEAIARGGETLVVRLRDASRPGKTCANDHPLSGCVTIDWFAEDASGRGEPLRNIVTLDLATGPHTFFLHENGTLTEAVGTSSCVDRSRYTALGGVARRWVGILPAALRPGGGIGFRLWLTKFGPPDVIVGYAVSVEP